MAEQGPTEDEKKSVEWAVRAIELIMKALPDGYCRATVAINIVKNALLDEAKTSLVRGFEDQHFDLMFEALCKKFADLVSDLPKDMAAQSASDRRKSCDCLACVLRRSMDEAADELLAAKAEKKQAAH